MRKESRGDRPQSRLREEKMLTNVTDWLRNEQSAVVLLEALMWEGTPSCPHCASRKVSRLGGRADGLWKCYICRKKFCVRSAGPFRNSHVKTDVLLRFIYLIACCDRIATSVIAETLEISERTAWTTRKKLDAIIKHHPPDDVIDDPIILSVRSCLDRQPSFTFCDHPGDERRFQNFLKRVLSHDMPRRDEAFLRHMIAIKIHFEDALDSAAWHQLSFRFPDERAQADL